MNAPQIAVLLLVGAGCSAPRPRAVPAALPPPVRPMVDEESAAPRRGLLPVPTNYDDRAIHLAGDWGGTRSKLASDGLQVDGILTQVGQDVTRGGRRQGFEYGLKFETSWKLDLDRSGTVPGGLLTMRTESRGGSSVNRSAGVVLPVADALFFPLTDEVDEELPIAVTELRYTQFLSKSLGLFLGKFTTLGGDANEFAGGRGDTQFMSHGFLSASVTALINPYSTVGGGVIWMHSDDLVVTSSIYAADDSSTTAGLDTLDDGLIWSSSVRTQHEWGGLPGGMMLTGQYGFDNEFVDFRGRFVSQDGFRIPLERDTWNVFWNLWQYLEVEPGSDERIDVLNGRTDREGLGFFARAAVADRDTNPIRAAFSGGLAGRGLFFDREHDTAGVGYVYSDVQAAPLATGTLLDTAAQRAELYYTFQFGAATELTLDLQWADSLLGTVDEATVLGFRVRTQF